MGGMQDLPDSIARLGQEAREAMEMIGMKLIEVTCKAADMKPAARVACIYNVVTASNGIHRMLATLIGHHEDQEAAKQDASLLINDGSMMLSAMMLATMCSERSGGTAVSYDIEVLSRCIERTERVLGRQLDGEIDPQILQAVREAERTLMEETGLTLAQVKEQREARLSREGATLQ